MTTTGPIGSKDPAYADAYVDVDEWRDEPVRHRYVHGGFTGTDARFSMYFPPAERYEGRFFQPVLPMSGIETAASLGVLYGIAGSVGFAADSGAYLVESNLGRLNPFPGDDWTVAGYRASAAVARYSRGLAADMYGDHRPYGYVFGGSGGALKTVSCFENVPDVWDGAVPFVMASSVAMPNVFSAQAHAMRLLWDRFPAIVDALEPGGSGDMYAGLTAEQRAALAEVTRMGFPPRAWFDVERLARGYTAVWSTLADNLLRLDPSYFEDFWTVPGYLGAHPPASLEQARIQHKTTVTGVVFAEEAAALGLPMPMAMARGTRTDDIPVAVRLAEVPEGNLMGAMLRIVGGPAAGRVMHIVGVQAGLVLTGVGEAHFEGVGELAEGHEVVVDNSAYLAFQTYHRHQVDPDYRVWDQFTEGGRPIYPQRPNVIGPSYARQGSGSTKTGRFAGKMIVVQTLMDEAAFPWQAVWYRDKVEAALGGESLDDRYRLWFVDHAMHTGADPLPGMVMPDTSPARKTRMVSYLGVLQQALRDVAAWVEHGLGSAGEHRVRPGRRPGARAADRRGPAGRPGRGRPDRQRRGPGRGRGGPAGELPRARRGPARRGHGRRRPVGLRGHRRVPAGRAGPRRVTGHAQRHGHPRVRRAGHVLPRGAGHHPAPGRPGHAARPGPQPGAGARGRPGLARRVEVDRVADGDRAGGEDPEDRARPADERVLGPAADRVVEELAGCRPADDLQLDVADAQPRPRGRGHLVAGDRDVPARAGGGDRGAQVGGGRVERGLRLDRHVPVPGAVVAVADQALAGLGFHRRHGPHRQPGGGGDVDGGDRRAVVHPGDATGGRSLRSRACAR